MLGSVSVGFWGNLDIIARHTAICLVLVLMKFNSMSLLEECSKPLVLTKFF